MNFLLKEKENTEYFAQFLIKGIFPSDQLIGLYSEEGFSNFLDKFHLTAYENQFKNNSSINNTNITTTLKEIPDDFDLWNKCAFLSYIHYPCAFIKYKNEFWQSVVNGYVHPKDYAMLEEWFAKVIGNPNYLHDCKEERQPFYYNIIRELSITDDELLYNVEAKRISGHLQKYSVDVLKKQLQKEHGIVFFFGFFHYR